MLTYARRAQQTIARSRGERIAPPVASAMASRLRHDFRDVRVHTGPEAAASARELGANAYTFGSHVVFGAGRYAPDTVPGARLLAHELTHVRQQHTIGPRVQRQGVHPPFDVGPAERDADLEEVAEPVKTIPSCKLQIYAEGTCEHLACNSKYACCDPEGGIYCEGKTKSNVSPDCPSQRWAPMFTCDSTCEGAIRKGCDDMGDWMALPGKDFARSKCNEEWTICANGKQTTGHVRDRSITTDKYEVNHGIQRRLGVPSDKSFDGAMYGPGTDKAKIDADPCCGGTPKG
jgi:uncharacterized protein DUF4157